MILSYVKRLGTEIENGRFLFGRVRNVGQMCLIRIEQKWFLNCFSVKSQEIQEGTRSTESIFKAFFNTNDFKNSTSETRRENNTKSFKIIFYRFVSS